MSQPPPPKFVAPQEVTVREKKRRTHCSQQYIATVYSIFFTFPLLLWVFTLTRRVVANAAQDHHCEGLLKADPVSQAMNATAVIMILLFFYSGFSVICRNWLASLGLLLLAVASITLLRGFPKLEDKTTFGIFHSSSPLVKSNDNNNSEYWSNNIRACVCRTEACEEMVYRMYLIKINNLEDFDSSGYTKLTPTDETKRHISPAQDLKGTSFKKGDKELLTDRSSLSSDSRYHEVCYSKKLGYDYEGNNTLCYDCYACEEKFLLREQRTRWRRGNILYLNNLFLIAVNLIVFLAESWARYME